MRTDISDGMLKAAVTRSNTSLNNICEEIGISMNTLKDFLGGNGTDETEKLIYSRLVRKRDTLSDYIGYYKESIEDVDNLNKLLKRINNDSSK